MSRLCLPPALAGGKASQLNHHSARQLSLWPAIHQVNLVANKSELRSALFRLKPGHVEKHGIKAKPIGSAFSPGWPKPSYRSRHPFSAVLTDSILFSTATPDCVHRAVDKAQTARRPSSGAKQVAAPYGLDLWKDSAALPVLNWAWLHSVGILLGIRA